MRPSLLPGLITAAQRNRDRGFADGALFELGQAYRGALPEDQFVAWPAFASPARHSSAPAVDIGPAKPLTLTFSPPRPMRSPRSPRSASTRRASRSRARRPSWFHPGRSGTLKLGPKTRARRVRRVPSRSAGKPRRRSRRSRASSFISTMFRRRSARASPQAARGHQTFSRSGATSPSCSTAMIAAGDVRARGARRRPRLDHRGARVRRVHRPRRAPGKKSLAIEVTLQPRDKTLTDAEIEAVAAKIVAAVTKATGGECAAKSKRRSSPSSPS